MPRCKHTVNPQTDRCVLCGKNRFQRMIPVFQYRLVPLETPDHDPRQLLQYIPYPLRFKDRLQLHVIECGAVFEDMRQHWKVPDWLRNKVS